MGKSNVSNKEKLSIPVMIFTIVGVVLVVLGFMLVRKNDFRMQVISTEGVVSGIQTSTDSNGNVTSKVYSVTYSANKGDYTASINNSSLDLKDGDKMTLYFDFFEPTSISETRGGYQGYLALIIGLIFVLKNGSRFLRIIRDNYILS